MTGNKLIMPKHNGTLVLCITTLKIYYENKGWLSNKEYKPLIIGANTFRKNAIGDDGSALIKRSEMARYFGLIEYDFIGRKAKITERGINFYEAYLSSNNELMIDIIMNSILHDSFGRNNYAIMSSDSDIDPPKLLLRATFDLQDLKKDEVAYFLFKMHNMNEPYSKTVNSILVNRNRDFINEIPKTYKNKYIDFKFDEFLEDVGILIKDNKKYGVSNYTYQNYSKELEMFSVYNTNIATEIGMDIIEEEYIEEEIIKKVPLYTSDEIALKNNRVPTLDDFITQNARYSTDYRISKTALSQANFKCEINTMHETFKTKYNIDYVEAHHLIPMKEQRNYPNINIDRTENIISVCPNCHKGIHYANDSYKHDKLQKLYNERKEVINSIGIELTYELLLRMYNVRV